MRIFDFFGDFIALGGGGRGEKMFCGRERGRFG